jgi:hypothetical protein
MVLKNWAANLIDKHFSPKTESHANAKLYELNSNRPSQFAPRIAAALH